MRNLWLMVVVLMVGCVRPAPPVKIQPVTVPNPERCRNVLVQEITYTPNSEGLTLVSAGDVCFGFHIEEGMGMVIMPDVPVGTVLELSLDGEVVALETLDFGWTGKQIFVTGNYVLFVDVPDDSSGTKLQVVINKAT